MPGDGLVPVGGSGRGGGAGGRGGLFLAAGREDTSESRFDPNNIARRTYEAE